MYKFKLTSFRFALKVIVLTVMVSNWADVAKANTQDPFDDVFVKIKSANTSLQDVFETVKSQTKYSFAYDNNEIDVSKKMTLKAGQITLNSLLEAISRQADLKFTQKNFTIIVSHMPGGTQTTLEEKTP